MNKTGSTTKSQTDRFKEAARELGTDESEERFNEALRKVGSHGAKGETPEPSSSARKRVPKS